MNSKAYFWIVVAIAICLYVAMVAWSLPLISDDANGLMPFDMRPGGYSFDEAKDFLAALSKEGNAFYRDVQHQLDLYFPFFEALAVGWAIFLLSPFHWQNLRWLLVLIPVPGMVFDYLENAHVAVMLNTGAENLSAQMVAEASFHTLMKSVFVTLSLVVLLVLIGYRLMQWRRSNKQNI